MVNSLVHSGEATNDKAVNLTRRVYLRVREMIENGKLQPGARLPSTRALSLELGVSRGTAVAAFEDLIADGLITTVAGSGTFVQRAAFGASRDREARRVTLGSDRSGAVKSRNGLSRRDILASRAALDSVMQSRFGQSFEIDVPAIDAFPFELWESLAVRLCKRGLHSLYRHSDPVGYTPLREAIAQYLGEMRGVNCDYRQIVIVTGTLQAIELICRVLVNDEQTVVLEEPGRACLRTIPRLMGANVSYASVDFEGINIDQATAGIDACMAIVTPSSHFPLGVTMSLERRLALLQWSDTRDSWIVEDDTGFELTATGRDIPALWSLDKNDRVIYASTFRSIMLPSLRLGFIVVPPDLVDSFVRMRFLADGSRPALDQALMAEFIRDGHLSAHVENMRDLYLERQTSLQNHVAKQLSGVLSPAFAASPLSLQTLFRITDPALGAGEVSRQAARDGIIARSLEQHYLCECVDDNLLILGHAAAEPASIHNDVARLARSLASTSARNSARSANTFMTSRS